jgi:acyl transferase domain-containing protein
VSNTDAVAYDGGEGWPERLSRHLIEPVRWRECQHTLAALGIDLLVEVGPGRVLAGLARRTVPEIEVVNVATPGDVDTALERLDAGAAAGAGDGDGGEEAGEQGRAHRDRDDGHPDRAVVVAAAAARHSASGPDLPPTEDPL